LILSISKNKKNKKRKGREGKGREGKGREGKERKGEGREGKGRDGTEWGRREKVPKSKKINIYTSNPSILTLLLHFLYCKYLH